MINSMPWVFETNKLLLGYKACMDNMIIVLNLFLLKCHRKNKRECPIPHCHYKGKNPKRHCLGPTKWI